MISFNHVSKHYPSGTEALTDVSFTLQQGDMAFLTGHSGAGKSTVLKLIMLMERASAGHVVVNHLPLHQIKARQIPAYRRHLGVIFQDHQLPPGDIEWQNQFGNHSRTNCPYWIWWQNTLQWPLIFPSQILFVPFY